MDESMMLADVEVCWDHDSPTPAAWKRLQGPGRNEDDIHCSPQLIRTKRKIPHQTRPSTNDYPRFEQSRKEVGQIIDALRKASEEGKHSTNIQRRLVIPKIPEEDESDDDRNPQIPFRATHPNTSLDMIFDMSGGGDDLVQTIKNTNTGKQSCTRLASPNADAWADDDLFTDDILMSEIGTNSTAVTPPKLKKTSSHYNNSSNKDHKARKTSTPVALKMSSYRSQNDRETSAKGFLDFLMDQSKPPKPSPEKSKITNGSQKETKYKFSSKSSSSKYPCNGTQSKTADLPVGKKPLEAMNTSHKTRGLLSPAKTCGNMQLPNTLSNSQVNNKLKSTTPKKLDTSIPPEVLEELIMEDSWTENEDQKDTKVNPSGFQKSQTPTLLSIDNAPQARTRNCRRTQNNQSNPYKFRNVGDPKASSIRARDIACKNSPSTVFSANKKQIPGIKKPGKQNVSSDGFSSDDEDLLLKVVALTESQQSSKGPSPREEPKKPILTSASHSVQGRCTASEIERKKRVAIERRMQRMKQQKLPL